MCQSHRILLSLLVFVILLNEVHAQRQFGFDNRKPSGQPYWKPAETVKKFRVSPGYEVKLFAGEPDVTNPIAFTIDEKGRVWVVENFEYPSRTPPGKKPRDRIKILEDTDGDGKVDKTTIWAEGKSLPIGWQLASGIEVGHGGVFLGAPPYLFFLQDTDGDGKCDKQEILLKGFGSQDTHETLNTFQWGPDSKLYGLHGVFTHSTVNGVRLNAAVWRYDPRSKNFEVFAEGTSNPWGMDFDSHGQCHLVCCVIPHLFHMVPGGTYIRQAGGSFNPYAYGLLKQSCDHTHHRESGWAHAGLLVMEGDHVPQSYRGSIIMGSIHGCSIKRDLLRRAGSTYLAGHAPDFVVSSDKNFRPINLRWGPDGSIYVIDWHDQNPCHQAPKNSWDKKHGRIYRIVKKGDTSKPRSFELSKSSSKQLVQHLQNDNPYWYRTALRVLSERRDMKGAGLLKEMLPKGGVQSLRALWGLYAAGALDNETARSLLNHQDKWMRHWAVRFIGDAGKTSPKMLKALTDLAKTEKAPEVRLQLASTAQRLKKQDVLPLLQNLMSHKEDVKDRFLPLMLWLAYEPRVLAKANPALDWLRKNAAGNPLVTQEIVPRTMRRLASTGKAEDLAACVDFLESISDSNVRREALSGITVALKNRKLKPPSRWRWVYTSLLKDNDVTVRRLARKLAVNFQDRQAVQLAAKLAADFQQKPAARIDAIQDLALAQPKDAIAILLKIVQNNKDAAAVRQEACRALSAFDSEAIPDSLLSYWKGYTTPIQSEVVNTLTGRKKWAQILMAAVAKKAVARTALNDNHILRMRAFRDSKLNQTIEKVWGQYRATPEKLQALISKMRQALDEKGGSFERGRKVFEANCAKCHKFDGKGHDVGPNLDGAGRDIDYLLVNVLDPNRVVGQPYFTRLAVLKNGRVETGLLVSEDPQKITLKGENNALKTLFRKDIDGKVLVQTKSVMPEGLTKNMSVQDLRDLVRYLMANPFLTDVAVAGPVSRGIRPNIDEGNPLAAKAVKWRRPDVGVTGGIALPDAGNRKATSLVFAEVTTDKPMTTELRLGAAGAVRVWLNGKSIFDSKSGHAPGRPDQTTLAVSLASGKNIVLFEVTHQGKGATLYARFVDPYRRLQYASATEK